MPVRSSVGRPKYGLQWATVSRIPHVHPRLCISHIPRRGTQRVTHAYLGDVCINGRGCWRVGHVSQPSCCYL